MQKQINDLLLVSVPEESNEIKIYFYSHPCLSWKIDNQNKKYGYEFQHLKLITGPWNIIATYPGITEEQAKPFVESITTTK